MVNPNDIKHLFDNWDDGLILSYLQGHMGYVVVDDEKFPKSAQIVLGDFCFFAGIPNKELIKKAAAEIIIPQNEAWSKEIENVLKDRVKKNYRYKIKKDINIFDREKLILFVNSLDKKFTLKRIDKKLYEKALKSDWSKDLCSQFSDSEDYEKRGLGFVILYNDKIVSGASSYVVYNEGIEIEIVTDKAFRSKGLATVCGANLILECLNRDIYPSWDAINLRSVDLANKLGYQLDMPYVVYFLEN